MLFTIKDGDETQVTEISIEKLAAIAQHSDGTGTKAKSLAGNRVKAAQNQVNGNAQQEVNRFAFKS